MHGNNRGTTSAEEFSSNSPLFSAIGKIGKLKIAKNGNLGMKYALPRHLVA
jgi:hypothetical protein